MFKKLIIGLVMVAVILLVVGFVGTYQENVFQPDESPFTVFVPQEQLPVVLYSYTNYDWVSIVPVEGGYLLTLKNRNPFVEMWQ